MRYDPTVTVFLRIIMELQLTDQVKIFTIHLPLFLNRRTLMQCYFKTTCLASLLFIVLYT